MDAFIVTENTLFKAVMITDQDRNRVIKVNKETSAIEWQYGDPNYREGNGPVNSNNRKTQNGSPAAKSILSRTRATIASSSLMRTPTISWQLGAEELNSPVDIQYVANGKILITDRGNHRRSGAVNSTLYTLIESPILVAYLPLGILDTGIVDKVP